MWWKAALVALLVLPPVSYVAGTLYAPPEAPDQRPALVLDDDSPTSAAVEPQVTLEPRPQPPRPPDRTGDDDGRDDVGDDGDDSGVTIVRPVPQVAGDDDDGDDDDRDDGDDGDDDERDDD